MRGHHRDNDILSSLKINTKNSIINILAYFADKEAIKEYNNCLKFVNVFEEIHEQWKSLFLIEKKWFLEIFTEKELLQLTTFDYLVNNFFKSNNLNLNFNEIINSKQWNEISKLANKILNNNNW